MDNHKNKITTLSIVIPCFNEENTLRKCVEKVLSIADESLKLEVIIVDDCSTDKSLLIAKELEVENREIIVSNHQENRGKGSALRTGFQKVTGDFVAVQDADLEYDPMELKKLLVPLVNNDADVVLGSRFLSSGAHRVLYFWHSLGNRFLTFISNMFTDLNLSDIETCYKVFRRDVIQSITIEENRFGFEPEIVAKMAHSKLRIFEVGISYYGRTYEEGKKIGVNDGFRAIYCILRYNAHFSPIPVQLLLYLFIGGIVGVVNLITFLGMYKVGANAGFAIPFAFVIAAILDYFLCISVLFRHRSRWNTLLMEIVVYFCIVLVVGFLDYWLTIKFVNLAFAAGVAKSIASAAVLILNFLGRRFLVFSKTSSPSWSGK